MNKSLVLLFLFVVGCAVEPKTSEGPVGSVSGHAILYSSNGAILPASSGITVTETATSKSAQTNDSGHWIIAGLPEGIHTFTFSKTGFGSVKIFGFTTTGKDTICDEEVDMSQVVSEQINFQRITVSVSSFDSIPSYNIIGSMAPPFLRIRALVLCVSADSATLVKDPGSAPILLPFVLGGSGYDGGFDWGSTSAFSTNEKAFAHGTQLYATVCVSGEGSDGGYLSNYFDPVLGKQVFTAIGGHSRILTAVMP